MQRELRQLKGKPQFEQLMKHCEQNCEGITLQTLLDMPAERVSSLNLSSMYFLVAMVSSFVSILTKFAIKQFYLTKVCFNNNFQYVIANSQLPVSSLHGRLNRILIQ